MAVYHCGHLLDRRAVKPLAAIVLSLALCSCAGVGPGPQRVASVPDFFLPNPDLPPGFFK